MYGSSRINTFWFSYACIYLVFVVVFSVKIRVMPMTPELKSIHGTMDVYIYVSTVDQLDFFSISVQKLQRSCVG